MVPNAQLTLTAPNGDQTNAAADAKGKYQVLGLHPARIIAGLNYKSDWALKSSA